jgi:hypothetical protein
LVVAGVIFLVLREKPATPFQTAMRDTPASGNASALLPKTLAELLALAPAQLGQVDIARMNLLCAEGLRGSEKLKVEEFTTRLDGIARQVEVETRRHFFKFHNNPAEFENSEAYFRMLYLFTVLQADVGIHYNPDRITPVGAFEPNSVFFADSRDVFIHGLIDDERRMGTCASMPALYVAIGRRLGYPLKLASAKNHLFIRWEDGRTRLNFDGTGRGMSMFEDNHYRQWPYPITPEEEQELGYLKSMTPAEELTAFLSLRGHSLMVMGKPQEAVAAHEAALRASPQSRLQQLILTGVRNEAAMRMARADFIPPEQLQWGAIPVGMNSHQLEVEKLVWQAQQFGRQQRGELAPTTPQPGGVPGAAPVVLPNPDPLRALRNQSNTP